MYLRPWIFKHAWAKFNLGQLVKVQAQELRTPNQWGSLIYKQWYAPTTTNLTLIFTPTSVQNPCFYQKLSPKVLFLSHCPEFWEFFTQRPLIGWNLRKRYPNVPYFYAFVTERPPIFCLAYTWFVWGECCSLKHGQKLENFVFSKQNRAIWWILSGPNLIEVMKIKFQFYRLNRPNCALWMNFIGGQGWYTGYYHHSQTWKGIYPTTTLYKSAHLAL